MDTLIHAPIEGTPTFEEAVVRLRYAGRMASDRPVENHKRWNGWFAFQTGETLPEDLFYQYACALDWHTSYPEESDGSDVLHYENELTAILAGRLMRKVA
jgi:hypothetical protein